MKRILLVSLVASSMLLTSSALAGAVRPGFDANTLPANDDGSTALVPIGFSAGIDFFGLTFNHLYVNNNGNVTFDASLWTYTPFDLTSTGRQIIAPFFADVDTRTDSNPVVYGPGTVDSRDAFGVTWDEVNCYSAYTSRLGRNTFQVVLVERFDTGPGNFDIEFNYDQIEWETGQASGGSVDCLGGNSARVGYSNGTGDPGTYYELPGSAVPGAFLDSGPAPTALIHNSLNSAVIGRYVFEAREGEILPPCDDSDGDGLCDADDPCPLDPLNDIDQDGVCGDVDNCPDDANPEQDDFDEDGLGDVCDPDDDNDGVLDVSDNCQFVPNPGQEDNDGDGDGDVCDSDDDNDGVPDAIDNCPWTANPGQEDFDEDGLGDVCDPDDDADGVPDASDLCPLSLTDPEMDVPLHGLRPNSHAWMEGVEFTRALPKGNGAGNGSMFTMADTFGCACYEIIDYCLYGNGHSKFGCSTSVMDTWVAGGGFSCE